MGKKKPFTLIRLDAIIKREIAIFQEIKKSIEEI